MCLLAPENPYPIYALPPLVRNAIIETQKNTQAPLAMVATSALTAISIACQNQIDVCRPGNLRGPVNLYSLILADSGERKTTVDKVFMKAFYLRDEALAEEYAKLVENYSTEKEIWEQKQKALESKFHKEIRAGKDYKATESELETHLNKSPVPPQIRRTIFNETTIEGMLKYYSDSNRSFALVSSEGGVIFDSRAMSKLGIINTLWDGGSLFIDRKSSPGINLKEPRLTMSAMIQPDVYHKGFCTRKKELVKTSGHHARFLMCQPTSTQGTRIITGDNYSSQ
ncbi:YfjI family protein, partial [Escherichia coli]